MTPIRSLRWQHQLTQGSRVGTFLDRTSNELLILKLTSVLDTIAQFVIKNCLPNDSRLNMSVPGGGNGANGGGGEPHDWWFWVRTMMVMLLGAISSLGSLGSNLAVEKDWVKV